MPTPVTRRLQVALCAAISFASFTTPAASQRPDTIAKAGTEVRMWSTRMKWDAQRGSIVSWVRTDTVIVAAKIVAFGKARTQRYQIPAWELDTLQVLLKPQGVRSRMEQSLIWGGIAGATIGAIVGIISLSADDCGLSGVGACTTGELGLGAGFFGLVGGLAGLAVGAIVGHYGTWGSNGTWLTVHVPRPAG